MQKATILVVEDDVTLLGGIRDILELEDYKVVTAKNGKEALRKLEDAVDPPDLIVSDIMMPYMDGIELLEHVRESNRFTLIPFIYMTARGEKSDIQRGRKLGVDDYIVKPFNADEMLDAISSRLGRSRDVQRVHEERQDELKRDILTILNHEFRTPLTFVVAYSEMLSDATQESSEEMITFLQGVKSGADRLHRLIENFITLVELETGNADKNYDWREQEIDDVQSLVEEAVDQGLGRAHTNHQARFAATDTLPSFHGDPEYLRTAISQMVDNACKFSADSDTIDIAVDCQEGELIIAVTDYGRGIPPHEHEKVWEKFYQVDREKYEDQGAGSGLTIVKHVADLHGGRVSLQSAPDQGSTFRLHLPVASEVIATPQQA